MEPDANCNVAYIMYGERLSCERISLATPVRISSRRIAANRRGEATRTGRRMEEDGFIDVSGKGSVEETASTAQPRYWKGIRARVHAAAQGLSSTHRWIEMKRSGNPEWRCNSVFEIGSERLMRRVSVHCFQRSIDGLREEEVVYATISRKRYTRCFPCCLVLQ